MIINGINFNVINVKSMKKKAFIDQHIKVFFLERSDDERKKILSDIYDQIKGEGVSDISKVEVVSDGGGGL
jgi:RNA-binding protein YhbY